MSEFSLGHEPSSERAYAAALSVAENFGDTPELSLLAGGPPSWTWANAAPGNQEANVVVRLTGSDDPETLLARTKQEVAVLRDAREHGAQVQEFLAEPTLADGFVTTVSRYLPGKKASYKGYGEALASLHNAGAQIDAHERLDGFAPLTPTRRTYDYLAGLYDAGETFQVQDVVFPKDLLPVFHEELLKAEATTEEMLQLSHDRGYPLTVLQLDVHIGNVRGDEYGTATLVDLDNIVVGPAEYDLSRPVGQWAPHFQRPLSYVQDFVAGYAAHAGRELDPDLVALGLEISNVRYATSLITRAVDAVREGHDIDRFSLDEGIRRLANIHDPNAVWISKEEYLRQNKQ